MPSDFRFALRSFRKSPAFTVLAVLALALGIGANSAAFTVVNAILLRWLPYRAPDRLVVVWESNPVLGELVGERTPVCLKNYLDWKREAQVFEDMAAFGETSYNLTGLEKPERVDAAEASPNFFAFVGVQAQLGRTFALDEGTSGRNRLALLSDDWWRKRFGASPAVLGRTLILNDRVYTVVGVLPPQFRLPGMWEGMDEKKPQLWTPMNTSPAQPRQALEARNKFVLARLRPGASLDQARAEMKVIAARLAQSEPDLNHGFSANVFPLFTEDVGADMKRTLLVLQVAVGFVLLIACANVANLLLARAAGREREIAIRAALGAGRWRLLRQMLAESLLLSLAGGAIGLLLAVWGIKAMVPLAPENIQRVQKYGLDWNVAGFTVVVTLATGVIFGLAPVLHAWKLNLTDSLRRAGRGGSAGMSSRVRAALVVSEIALAVVLLAGAGLMIRTLASLMAVNLGYRSSHLLTAQIELPPSHYPNEAAVQRFVRQVIERLATLPGVRSVAAASGLPLQRVSMQSYSVEGRPQNDATAAADSRLVTAGYFETMGMPILSGRAFTREETEKDARVLIVNQAFAGLVWPGRSPLGNVITTGDATGKERRFTVVGVTSDSHQLGLDLKARPEFFQPTQDLATMTLAVHTAGEPMRMASAVTAAVWAIDKDLPVYQVRSMEQSVREWTSRQRFIMLALTLFAALALVLAAVGMYGVLAYSVSQRTHEIGIRVALGAEARQVFGLVVGQGMSLTLAGLGIGLVGAFGLTRLMTTLLFGVKASDPLTYAAVCAALLVVAFLAVYVPARRAAHVDPVVALREE